MTKKITKFIKHFSLLIGVVFLILLVRKIGLHTIFDNICSLGFMLIPILGISGLWYVLYTSAWMQFLRRLGNNISFLELFKIKLTGEAVNTLTPINFVGGDPLRIYLLKKNFPVAEGAASVVVDRTLHSAATLIVIIIGISVAFMSMHTLPANLKYGVPIALLVCAAFMTFIFVHQRRGFFGLMLNTCMKLGLKKEFSEKTVKKFLELDTHIIDFYEANHRGFIIAILFHVLGRLLGVVEIYAIGATVSDDFSLLTALILTALAPMVNAVFAFIPGAIGVLEGAYSGVLYLLHLDPALGITIQIAKRIRSAFWISLGLYFLSAHDRKRKVWEGRELIEQI